MCDRESKDLARKEKRGTPSPDKKKSRPSRQLLQEDNKENEGSSCRKSIDFSMSSSLPPTPSSRTDENENNFDHPVYKQISLKNGLINKSDLSTLKHMCRQENIESSGKRNLIQQRLKNYFKAKMLREVGLLKNTAKGYEYFLVIDFEATCEERNAPDYPHEIIEFPGVIVDGKTGEIVEHWREYCRPVINPTLSDFCTALTGITQQTVDAADTFTDVLEKFNLWLEQFGLGSSHTFALVTDGPFDVGRFLRLNCQQVGMEVPVWAEKWINLRKGFANFYKASTTTHLKLPGLQTMLTKLDMEFEGNPHSGLDDATNIARVVSRMVMDGAILKVNEKLELHPPPVDTTKRVTPNHRPRLIHVSPLSRTQADVWLSSCRQITKGCKELKL